MGQTIQGTAARRSRTPCSRASSNARPTRPRPNSGTAYISQLANTKIEDREALFDFIAEHWDECGNDMLKLGVSIDPIRNYMQSHDGALPPGVSISHYNRLNIRRSHDPSCPFTEIPGT